MYLAMKQEFAMQQKKEVLNNALWYLLVTIDQYLTTITYVI